MKKNILLYSLMFVAVVFFTIPKNTFAVGTIQLVNFNNQINEDEGYRFSVPINFIYSGSHGDQLGVSILGSNSAGSLPHGVSLGSVFPGSNGVATIDLSGTPTQAGSYPLTLVITDNSGALLTQSFTLTISPNDVKLPDAVVNQKYSQDVSFGYYNISGATGSSLVFINFSAWKNGMKTNDVYIDSAYSQLNSGATTLELTPRKAGQYVIEADIIVDNNIMNTEMLKLNVIDLNNSAPASSQTTNQNNNQPVATPTPITKVIYIQVPSSSNNGGKTIQSTTTTQNTQQQGVTTTVTQTNPQPVVSHNIFVSFWNFLKRLF